MKASYLNGTFKGVFISPKHAALAKFCGHDFCTFVCRNAFLTAEELEAGA